MKRRRQPLPPVVAAAMAGLLFVACSPIGDPLHAAESAPTASGVLLSGAPPASLMGDNPLALAVASPQPSSTPEPTVSATSGPVAAATLPAPATPAQLLQRSPPGAAETNPQVSMDIVLNYVDRRIQVRQDIDLTNTTLDPWAEIVFAVPPAHQADVFVLERAEVTTVDHHRVVPGRLTGIMLSLPLQDLVNPGDPMRVRLVYEIRVPAIDPTRWLPEGNLGMGERVLQVGDWHPTLVPYGEGDGWQTWDYHPVGDPVVYPIADYDVQLSADPRVVVAAPGFQSQQGLRRTYLLTEARSFAFLASPEYRVIASSTLGMSLRTYYLPGNERAARATLTTAVQAIELFEELYGPYPSDELIIAQNAYLGSMEYSGLLSISTEAYDTYVANPGALLVGLVVHETAHQWWYGAVGNDQVHEPWLDEAFAKYSELLFYEHYEPDLVPWWWDTHVMRYGPEGSLNRTIYDFDGTPDYFSELYGQAARFLADLRREMGNEEFFRFVRAYRQQGEGALVTGEAFFQLLLASTDKDLSELIDRYFDNPDG